MKCRTVIDQNRDEEVVIFAHRKTPLTEEIESFVSGRSHEILGYDETSVVPLESGTVYGFTVEEGKVFALTEKEKLRVRQRLYILEDMLGDDFVKINQSTIVNVKKIARFDTSFAGALTVILKNGYRDYVSRRQLKFVKERIGF